MALVNLLIQPITGYTPTQMAQAISAELLAIMQPYAERQENFVTQYLFDWRTHPTTGACVLLADTAYKITVHLERDLTALLALFPTLSSHEKAGLTAYIEASQTFFFGAIIPSNSTFLTDAQLEEDGWNEIP